MTCHNRAGRLQEFSGPPNPWDPLELQTSARTALAIERPGISREFNAFTHFVEKTLFAESVWVQLLV